MRMRVDNYGWHEFFPNGKMSLSYFLLIIDPDCDLSFQGFNFDPISRFNHVVTHNIGVVIAIWAPILMVSGTTSSFTTMITYFCAISEDR